ncbi:MAG TPA: RDD family protein [Pyrinomonadaceae bacterium]|nr:RDD family protein [Pyrinomonadaceae bacterium]
MERRPAQFSLRCGAMLIDYIVCIAIVALSTLIARMFGGGARTSGSSAEMLGIMIALSVAVLDLGVLAGLTGKTIGKWTTGLRVQRPNGEEPGVGRALLRHFVGYPLSFLTLGFGFLLAALTTRGRALHDFIADTVVVRD